MKRILNAIGKKTKDAKFQQKAVKKVEDIEKGEKILAPKYPREEKRVQQALADESLKEKIHKKDPNLIDNMAKLNIKDLPTRESEWMHRNDPVWEYGFYEPEEGRIPRNKLMFREALEVLRARQESEEDPKSPHTAKWREDARRTYEEHKAVKRVEGKMLEDMWEFFRPFVRKDYQKVVSRRDLAQLQQSLHGLSDETRMIDSTKDGVRQLLQRNKEALEQYDRLEAREREQLQEAIAEQRQFEKERLASRLKDIERMEKLTQDAVEEVRKKSEEEGKK
ncbi:unnamed protein product [Nippostrongylus brasiliensis]|uniref:39S ribosomal protein L59, mitochondrial n=1 Tax=Nippostrongylus brasiliensis TaxID=27835 RepID=A0A0N4YPU7_NIPBR|nr:unnamed protein product [Nippostrongylus brasiliensis]